MLLNINKLNPGELKRFKLYVNSPYFNTYITLKKLFEYIEKGYPFISKEYISMKNISLNVYNEKRVNELKVRKLISDFNKLFKGFLLQTEIEKNTAGNKLNLVNALDKRQFDYEFFEDLKDINNQLTSVSTRDEAYYSDIINFEKQYCLLKLKHDFKFNSKSFINRSDNIDYYYILKKLEVYFDFIVWNINQDNAYENIKDMDYALGFVMKKIPFFKKNHPLIYLKYLGIKLQDTKDEKYARELENCLEKDRVIHNSLFLQYHYAVLENFYLIQHKEISDINERRLMKLYNYFYMMETSGGNYSDDTYSIFSRIYLRVINIGLRFKHFEWTDKFIEKFKDRIHPADLSELYFLGKARFYFETNDFENSIIILNKVRYKDTYCFTNSKFLLARLYYEQKYINGIVSIIKNLKQYIIRNKKFTKFQTMHTKIFLRYMPELLIILKSSGTEKKFLADIMRKKLDGETELVANKNWYYEKLDEISEVNLNRKFT